MKRELTCIGCPLGCALVVNIEDSTITVTGNTCPRGEKYGIDEVTHPVRTLTTTVAVSNGDVPRLSVKTSSPVPRDSIPACMEAIRHLNVPAPVDIGDVVLHNCAGTGADVIATKKVMVADHHLT